MRNKIILSIIMLFVSFTIGFAQNSVKRPDSYNYSRGVEAIQKNNTEEALEYLNKELSENPKNGYAFAWIGVVRVYQTEYGRALTTINNALKHLPKKDKEYMSFAYGLRANVYLNLGDTISALNDYGSAIKYTPDDEELYEKRAQVYFELRKYDLADKDYRQIMSLNQGSVMGYMGLGRNANAQNKFEDAIAQFNYVIKLASDYSSGYSFRAESYIGLKKYNEAIDDIIKALDLDYDSKAFYLMQQVADSSYTEIASKIKVQCIKNPNNGYWPYCLGVINEHGKHYKKAVEQYILSFQKDGAPITAYRIASCYKNIGDYSSALKYIDLAIEADSTDYDYVLEKADLLYETGKTASAVLQLTKYINHYPDFYYGYYRRGFYKDNTNDVDGAIEDYSMSIVFEPMYAYAYLGRADMYQLKGEQMLAKKDYEKVIELDTVPENSSCAQYAFLALAQKEKAINFMNRIIEADSLDAGNYYDAACIYSRMGENQKALEYLKKSFEKGYRRFSHIDIDDDLNSLRNLDEFRELVEYYKESFLMEIEGKTQEETYIERIVEIPFTKEGEVCKVKCTINNLPLHFIFDTGASNVSMSNVEATFMLKNDYLGTQDVQGKQNYITADGDISEGTIVNLRNVEFGGLILTNVKASIVKNQKAPLLLGQSVLKRLGKIEIDNERRVLKITYKEKK